MISSQIAVPTEETDYNDIEKVYTIWICRNNIPKKLQNTMSVYEITNTKNSKNIELVETAYDLMSMVILRLGDPRYDDVEDIFKILNALFYPRKQKSYDVLKDYVDFSETLTQEVKRMSGLGESVFFEGVEEGRQEGRQEGMGEKEKEMIISMHTNDIPINQISKIAKLPLEKVKEIIQTQGMLV